MPVKKSRTGKKKRSQYRQSAKDKAKQSPTLSPAEQAREKKRVRLNAIALILLLTSLVLILFAPKVVGVGLPQMIVHLLAYSCTTIAGAFMLLSLPYTKVERQTTTRVTGFLMLFVGGFGIVYTAMPLFQ